MAFTEELILKAKDQATETVKKLNISMETLKKTTAIAGAVFTSGAFIIKSWATEAVNADLIYQSLESSLKRNMENIKEYSILGSENTVITTNNSIAVKKQTEELKQLAFGLQNVSVFSGDNIVQAQALLANFGLTTDQIKRTTPAVVDFASKMSMMSGRQVEVSEAANLIGRAFEGNVIGLRRYGINLSENGKVLKNFDDILKKVVTNTKGAGQDFANTAAGGMAIFKNAVDDLKRDLGMAFLPVLKDITENGLMPMINFLNGLSAEFKNNIAITVLVVTAISGIVTVIGAVGIAISVLTPTVLAIIGYFSAFTIGAIALYEVLLKLSNLINTGFFDKITSFFNQPAKVSPELQAYMDQKNELEKPLKLNVNNQPENNFGDLENTIFGNNKAQTITGNPLFNNQPKINNKPKIYNGIRDFFADNEDNNLNNNLLPLGAI